MAGRFAYFLIAGGAIVGGMALQGDLNFEDDHVEREVRQAVVDGDREIDRAVDRVVDRAADDMVVSGENGQAVETDPAMKRALAAAVAELARAEASLITARLDEAMPAAAIEQAEQRRDATKQAVERIAEDIRTEARAGRDALRENIRDQVRDSVRDAVRS